MLTASCLHVKFFNSCAMFIKPQAREPNTGFFLTKSPSHYGASIINLLVKLRGSGNISRCVLLSLRSSMGSFCPLLCFFKSIQPPTWSSADAAAWTPYSDCSCAATQGGINSPQLPPTSLFLSYWAFYFSWSNDVITSGPATLLSSGSVSCQGVFERVFCTSRPHLEPPDFPSSCLLQRFLVWMGLPRTAQLYLHPFHSLVS